MSWPGSIDVVYSVAVCWSFWLWLASYHVYTSGDTTLSRLRVLHLAEIMDLFLLRFEYYTTALVFTLTTAVCPETTATYAVTKMSVCSVAGLVCQVGQSVTSTIQLTVVPAQTGCGLLPVPGNGAVGLAANVPAAQGTPANTGHDARCTVDYHRDGRGTGPEL